MNKQELIEALKKLDSKHKQLPFFEKENSAIALKLLSQAVARAQRIAGEQNPTQEKAKASIGFAKSEAEAEPEEAAIFQPDFDATPEAFRAKILKSNPLFRYEDLPENLQKAYDAIGEMYQERVALHEKAKASAVAEERAQAIARVVNLTDSISALYQEIDNYVVAQSPENLKIKATAEKMNRIRLISSTISKLKVKIEDADAEKRQALLEEMENLLAEKKALVEWQKSLK